MSDYERKLNYDEALRYLGYGKSTPDEKTEELLLSCGEELKKVVDGKFIYKVFDLVNGQPEGINFELHGESVAQHLKNCNKVIFLCATLSAGVDLLIRKKQITSMTEAMIMDSLA